MTQEQFYDRVMIERQGQVIHIALVLHAGWEMDNYIAVVEFQGKRHLVGTDHGQIVDLTPKQVREYLQNTEESLRALTVALGLAT